MRKKSTVLNKIRRKNQLAKHESFRNEGVNHGFFHWKDKGRFVKETGSVFTPHQFEYFLRSRGYSFADAEVKLGLPDGRSKLLEIIEDFSIDRLIITSGGWLRGIHQYGGRKALVINDLPRIEAIAGDFRPIKNLLDEVFPEQIEREYFLAWLYLGCQGFYHLEKFCPGQLLVLVGDGSDFVQRNLITAIFGGRSTNSFHQGAGLVENYSWAVPSVSINLGSKKEREQFAFFLELCETASKRTDEYLPLYSRGSICLKHNVECVQVLEKYLFTPEVSLSVLSCSWSGVEDSVALSEQVRLALPAFIWHLQNEYSIRADLIADNPCKIKDFFVSSVKNFAFLGSPECEFLGYLRQLSGEKSLEESEIQTLMEVAVSKSAISKLTRERSLGSIMASLAHRYPQNFSLAPGDNKVWTLKDLQNLKPVT